MTYAALALAAFVLVALACCEAIVMIEEGRDQ